MRALRYVWVNLRGGWEWFAGASREERWEALFRWFP
jgi:hypothetical protein